MSSRGKSKKSGGSGGSGGQSKMKMKKSASSNASPVINPAAQPEYAVEKITGKRFWNGRPQVLVQWLGYPPEKSTWEPMENVGNCLVLLADFEAEFFKRTEHKKSLEKVLDQNMVGATQVTSPGMELKAPVNATTSGIPKPNAGHKMGNHKENPLVKMPLKQRLTPSMQLCEISDNKDLLFAPSSFGKRDYLGKGCDGKILSSASPSSKSFESSKSSGSGSQLGQWKVKTEKKVFEPTKTVTHSATSGDPIDQALKSIHSTPKKARQVKNEVQESLKTIHSTPKKASQVKNEVQESSKKNGEKTPKKSLENGSSDDDSDSPNPKSKFFHWKLPLYTEPFGLARGLELDKVEHHFQVRDKMFMFVQWKGCDVTDAVPLEDLRLVYPAQIIQYFEKMKRRY